MDKNKAKKKGKEIYMNNPSLPTPEAEFEWTPEMIKELKTCKTNLLHFAENYFYIINLDEGKQKIKLHSYQKKALRMIRDNRFSLFLFSRQSGKCLDANTLCKIRDKKTGEIQELTIEKFFDMFPIEKEGTPDKTNNLSKSVIKKFIESRKVEDFEIWSDEGWVDIQQVHKTIKFDVWVVETENFELQCADEHIVIGENRKEIYIKDLKIGDKIITENGLENVIRVEKLDTDPEHMYDISIDSQNHTFFSNGILSHNSTIATIYMLWTAIFNDDQRILLVANKESTAKEIFKRIRTAYEQLPNWIKSPVQYYGLESLELSNGSRIGITTTTGTAGRGSSANLLFVDEAAFVDSHLLDEFWASVYPIISSSTKSKVIMASTPKDTTGLFYKLYDGSAKGTNNWAHMVVRWDEIPGRSEKWKRETIASLGDESVFRREFECQFDQVGESAIDVELLDKLKKNTFDPLYIFDEGRYLLWETPNENRIYSVGVDVAEGVGRDSTVMQILDITNPQRINQVGIYHNNKISPVEFTPKLREILQHWGDPLVFIERNNCGGIVVDNLKKDFNYENIVNWGVDMVSNKRGSKLGIVNHINTKYTAIVNQRYWLNTCQYVQINDINTVHELNDFVKLRQNSWGAKTGSHDDRVMALVWSLLALHESIVGDYFDILERDENNKPSVIKSIDYGIKHFMNPVSMYFNEKEGNVDAMPIIIAGNNPEHPDIDDLHNQGWKPLYGD